jgi:uncharacterized membrane protein YfcA
MSSKIQNNLFIILERFWLAGALISAACAVYFLIIKDNDSALFFFGLFILSALFYILRKGQRKKQEAYLKAKENEGKK